MRAWRIAVDAPDYEAHDLAGIGAERSGGRWNSPGRRVVYCADSRALAALETWVHVAAPMLPMNRYLVAVDIPPAVWERRIVHTAEKLPVGWDASPHGAVSLRTGDDWLRGGASAVLQVPSAIVPEECCVLINPAHADAAKITAQKVRRWLYDARLAPPPGRRKR